tara:strand:- start:510 stop:1142 length:633 start_codon:yes stop_codon:yes gene_type:complete
MLNILLLFLSINIQKPALIFFTGGSNFMTERLYNDFFTVLEKDFEINKLNFYKNYDKQIKDIYEKNKNLIICGHSSGCVTAINIIDNNAKYVDELILLDPVKTPTFKKKNINMLKKVLIIDAELSYKWSKQFPYVPFIPFLKINNEDLNIRQNKVKRILIKNYGHSDLIDNPWRDLMHNTRISKGNPNRSNNNIKKYYEKLNKIILDFIK